MTASAPTHIDPFDIEAAFRMLPIAQLVESEKNPRKHFDQAKLEQLADNIGKHGVLTPMLARPMHLEDGEYFELAAGHRRYRAARMAGVTHVPVRLIELDDVAFLEVLTIENLQREDIHPLEEGQGYKDLMRAAGYSAAAIGGRVGKSEKYVYDRIKLIDLVPDAQRLFLDGRFTAGHAILLARLKPADQLRAIDPKSIAEGLWRLEFPLFRPDEKEPRKGDKYENLKPVSVRELQAWIDRNVRLDPSRDNDVLVFPEIATVFAPAKDDGRKVVPITFEHTLAPDLKDDANRTYGPKMWKRADGDRGSKSCEYSVMGFIAVGAGRGDAFDVCLAKTKCRVHWPQEVAAAARKAKEKTEASALSSGPKSPPAAPKKSQWEIENEKREARRAEWMALSPFVVEASAAAIKKLPLSKLAELIFMDVNEPEAGASKLIGRGKTAEEFVRWLAFGIVFETADNEYSGEERFKSFAKLLGIDVGQIRKNHAPTPDKAAAKSAKKKAR